MDVPVAIVQRIFYPEPNSPPRSSTTLACGHELVSVIQFGMLIEQLDYRLLVKSGTLAI